MKILFSFLICINLYANIAEHFGASTTTMGLAGQSNFKSSDPSNNIYAAAILADEMKTSYSLSSYYVQTNFKKISKVVTDSPINSGETTEKYGSIDPNPDSQMYSAFHGSFALFKAIKSKLNISFFLPSEKIFEANSGDPYRPEYVMYNSRFNRTIGYVTYAQKLESFNFSIGFMSGIQSNGETFIIAKDNGSQTPSSGKMQFNAKPSTALNFSFSKETDWGTSFFSFQDEMKSKFENKASGYTPIGAGPINFSWDMSSMLFYDPRIYRLSHNFKNYFFSLEYQDWSGYETPVLKMKSNSSSTFVSSSPLENFTTQSILIPKVGFTISDFNIGVSYKPSPLKLKDGAAGNSIDTDTFNLGLGYNYQFRFLDQSFLLSSAIQYQRLKEITIKKDPKRENGENGEKIGAPSYKVGGDVYALSIGLSWVL